MIRRRLDLIAVRIEGGRIVLRSPAVGLYSHAPREREGLTEGSFGGSLSSLGRTIDLLVPPGADGTVVEIAPMARLTGVAYGDPLFTLEQAGASEAGDHATGRAGSGESPARAPRRGSPRVPAGRSKRTNSADLEADPGGPGSAGTVPEGTFPLRAPTTGIFYARPDPASPPFAEAGSILETGQTAGYIEVMKCFSPILHPGGAVPSPGRVEQVCVREGEEVHPGRILFLIRPA